LPYEDPNRRQRWALVILELQRTYRPQNWVFWELLFYERQECVEEPAHVRRALCVPRCVAEVSVQSFETDAQVGLSILRHSILLSATGQAPVASR
jgi:hypothetical protein